MWPWLASLYTVLGVLAVLGAWLCKVAPMGWVIAAVWEGRDRRSSLSWLSGPAVHPGGNTVPALAASRTRAPASEASPRTAYH
jgi:S-DNA-T family DNA segregation ATPase FtsK/SpoIIIE